MIGRANVTTREDNVSAVQKAYKTIKNNINLSLIKEGCKRLVVTSASPREGKSTTAVNIAISLAQEGKRVLIVDCDLKKPKIHKAFGIADQPGLTNIVSEQISAQEVISETRYANLFCLPAGIVVPNPSEILANERIFAVLEELEEQFDFIIFDTPPLNVVSDAMPVIELADGVILVVRSKISLYSEFEKALSTIENAKAKLLGVIVNGETN